jgi:PKD repeat protein
MRRKLLSTIVLVLLGYELTFCQIVFWSEDFDHSFSNCALNSAPYNWTVHVNGSEGALHNEWYIYYAANYFGLPCVMLNADTNNGALYIGYGLSDCDSAQKGPIYRDGCDHITNRTAISPVIDCSGKHNITLGLDLASRNFTPGDVSSILFSHDGGTTWDTLETVIAVGRCIGSQFGAYWEHRVLALPSTADNNSNVKIGFAWKNNDDCFGNYLSFAIDNITLADSCYFRLSIGDDIVRDPCVGQSFTLLTTSGISNPLDSIFWNFGNGDTSTALNPSVIYDSTGIYIVTLIARDTSGCTQITTKTINVSGFEGNISADTNNICPYDCVDFLASIHPMNILGIMNSYVWSFDDSNSATDTTLNPHYCFSHAGLHNVQLHISNPLSNCVRNLLIPITVDTCGYPVLTSIISSLGLNICQGSCIDFSNNAFDAVNFNWSFTGASITASTDSAPSSVCFDTAGVYSVILTVANGTGTSSITTNIIVHEIPPVATIYLSSGPVFTTDIGAGYNYDWYVYFGAWIYEGSGYPYHPLYPGDPYKAVVSSYPGCSTESNVYVWP